MKTIIDNIKETLPRKFGRNFVYDSEQRLNVILDNGDFPLAFMNLVESGTINDAVGRFRERMTIEMNFAALADNDMDGEENERIIDEMKRVALGEWLPSLYRADGLKVVGVNSTKRIYMQFGAYDVMLTAYVVNVTIEETESFGQCN